MKTKIIIGFIITLLVGMAIGYQINEYLSPTYQFKTGENLLQNSGFEDGSSKTPNSWYQAIVPADNLTTLWDNSTYRNGTHSVYINNTHIYDETVCNNWAQTIYTFPTKKNVELNGWVKTIDADSVVMVIQCWNLLGSMVAFGTTQTTIDINGTTDWQQYTASVSIPDDTHSIIVRLVLTGSGQVWFDDVTLTVL